MKSRCALLISHLKNDLKHRFPHAGHRINSKMQGIESTAKNKGNSESKEPCFLCGNDVPPEVDGRITNYIKWFRCNVTECRSLAHEWCIKLLGKKCMQCEKGMLVVTEESSLQTD
ncbi:hypothetical protein OSTOST_16866 [Ostertagia ostertagi]